MRITKIIPKALKEKLNNKIPKSKGTNQIGDRFKLLAHEVVNSNIGYDEAIIRAVALYLRREEHLKSDKNLDKAIEYIQTFLNETKSFSDLNLINVSLANKPENFVTGYSNILNSTSSSKKSVSQQNNMIPNKPKQSTNNLDKLKQANNNFKILTSKNINSKSNGGFYLSRKLYEQYSQSMTLVCTGYSVNSNEHLTSLLDRNKKNLNKLSLVIFDNLDIHEVEKLSVISKSYNVDIKIFDKLCSLHLVVNTINSKLIGFIDFTLSTQDINIEECLDIASYNSILLPSKVCEQGLSKIIEQNFDSGVVIPTYLLKSYDAEIEPFSINLLLLRLLDIRNVKIGVYQSAMKDSIKLKLDDVLKYVNSLKEVSEFHTSELLQKKYHSLCKMLKDVDSNKLLELSMKLNTPNISFSDIYPQNAKKVDTLVVAYNFTPFMDPSAIVVAKRIQEEKWVSDVVANDMSELRKRSPDLSFIGKPYINSVITIYSKASFAHQPHYQDYIDRALEVLELEKYERVYSRSFFISAHFLGFEIKQNKPDIYWVAEFSDPGVFDVEKKERYAWYRDISIRDQHVKLVYEKYPELKKYTLERNDNVYFWAELLPYCFADEIIFTCENQRRIMLANMEIKELVSIVLNKSIIKPQPTLPKPFYQFKNVDADINLDCINIAYFGSFYVNRNFDDVFKSIASLNKNDKEKVRLHIYTNQIQDVIDAASQYDVRDNIIVSNYLDYLDFLNVLNKFDCLFLMDTKTEGTFEVNPYLPSKLSDYLGADAKIWAHCEEGSTLSNHEKVTYKSYLNDHMSINSILKELTSKQSIAE